MTARVCTCAGTAPGYPQHESHCDVVTGDNTPARELEEAEQSRLRAQQQSLAMFGVADPWTAGAA